MLRSPFPPGRVAGLIVLLAAAAAAAAPKPGAASGAKPAATSGAKPDQKVAARVEALRRAAAGTDPAASAEAVDELKEIGDPGRKALVGALRQVLNRDRGAIRKGAAGAGSAEKFAALLARLEETRKDALENVGRIAKGDDTVKKAHDYFKELAALQQQANNACAAREPLARALARRGQLLSTYREALTPEERKGERQFSEAEEAKLQALAEKALGLSADDARSLPAFGPEDSAPPGEPAAEALWFYGACRRIEAYNNSKAVQEFTSPGERENLKFVNGYREILGLMPLEADARLTQAARRHSREMVEKNFFAHESPTPANKTFVQRIENAGYGDPAAENIAYGPTTGEQVFWGWFDSPGHHKNLAADGLTALGVGRWNNHWTQNFGRGSRLMFLPEDRRKTAGAVKGDVVRPQK